jgi:hypothetical protein
MAFAITHAPTIAFSTALACHSLASYSCANSNPQIQTSVVSRPGKVLRQRYFQSGVGAGYQGHSMPSTFFVELVRVDAVRLSASRANQTYPNRDYLECCDCLVAVMPGRAHI